MPKDFRGSRRLKDDYRRSIEQLIVKYLKVPKDATAREIQRKVNAPAKNKGFLERLGRIIARQSTA